MQAHVLLEASNHPLTIDFYASFCHSPPRGSARFRLEPFGQRSKGKNDVL
jgi:hypothetical protein